MDLLNILGLERRIEQAKKESPDERYARVEIDLGAAENVGKNIMIQISGDYLAKIKYNGSAKGCYFKFGTKRSSIIYASEFRKRHTPFVEFPCIFLTNEVAQAGKELTFFVGGAFAGEIEPSTGEKIGLVDSNGADIDPAIKGDYSTILASIDMYIHAVNNRHKSHTWQFKEQTTQTAAGTREKLMAATTKVRWAIIHFETVARVGDTTVTVDAGAHPGQQYKADSYLTLEFCDLNDINIIDAAGVAVIYTITYIREY